jgi:putative SOS response-associated peptidase YedK
MCGRFALTATPQDVRALFGYEDTPNFPPREAIKPTEPVAVVVKRGGARRFVLMRWGFIPAWVKDPAEFPLLYNARGETLADKPAFRAAARRRRCLVPADGFHEWRRTGEGRAMTREPFFVSRSDGRPMAMAGVWETYMDAGGGEIDTVAIVTTAANGTVAAIHDRMPAIVEPRDFDAWLDSSHGDDCTGAMRLVQPAADDTLTVRALAPPPPRRHAPAPRKPSGGDGQGSLF